MTTTGLAARSIERAEQISEQLAHRARDGEDGVVRTVERVPAALTHHLETLDRRITSLEERPEPPVAQVDDASKPCPHEGQIREFERRLIEIESTTPEQLPVPISAADVERQLMEVLKQAPDYSEQIGFVTKRINSLDARLTEIGAALGEVSARPYVSEDTIRALDDGLNAKILHLVQTHVNSALGDLRSRMVAIERAGPSTGGSGEPQSTQVTKLAGAVSQFGEYVRTVESDLDSRVAAVEQMYAEIAQNITDTNVKTIQLSARLYRALQALEHDGEAAA